MGSRGGPSDQHWDPPPTTSKARALLPLDVLLNGHPMPKPVNPVALSYDACDARPDEREEEGRGGPRPGRRALPKPVV